VRFKWRAQHARGFVSPLCALSLHSVGESQHVVDRQAGARINLCHGIA
jgi:hypothetical protein